MIQPFAERTHDKMKEVLMNSEAEGPAIHYYMIRGGSEKKNITVWEAGTVGGEYIKAYGHYHIGNLDETYSIIHGKGILLLQKCKKDSDGKMIIDEIATCIAVSLTEGDQAYIPSGVGHLLINTGQTWLVASDDSPVNFTEADPVSLPGHADYESVKKMHGFAYYVVEKDGKIEYIKNTNYKVVPEIQVLTSEEYKTSNLL